MARIRLLRKITPARVVITTLLLTGFNLLLIVSFGFFRHLPYFRFFLLCVMGFAFLLITYMIRH